MRKKKRVFKRYSKSRQRQLKYYNQGRCIRCGATPLNTANHCHACAELIRVYYRNRYRISHNLPLDAPPHHAHSNRWKAARSRSE